MSVYKHLLAETKHQWARDDPAFLVLLSLYLCSKHPPLELLSCTPLYLQFHQLDSLLPYVSDSLDSGNFYVGLSLLTV